MIICCALLAALRNITHFSLLEWYQHLNPISNCKRLNKIAKLKMLMVPLNCVSSWDRVWREPQPMKDRRRRGKWEGRWTVSGRVVRVGDTEMDAVGSWRWGDAVMIRSRIYPWANPRRREPGETGKGSSGKSAHSQEFIWAEARSSGLWGSWRWSCAPAVCLDTPGDFKYYVGNSDFLTNKKRLGNIYWSLLPKL